MADDLGAALAGLLLSPEVEIVSATRTQEDRWTIAIKRKGHRRFTFGVYDDPIAGVIELAARPCGGQDHPLLSPKRRIPSVI